MTAGREGDPAAAAVFGERLPVAEQYARSLATDGVIRGLIGPREAPRLWERHLLNCAVVAELIPPDATVTDVGSGAGLPGVALAVARPDLAVTLVEAKERAAAYLSEVVRLLGLAEQVAVVRSRAEDCADRLRPADVVTARALGPLDRLAGWCLPLAAVGTGRVLALKGSSVESEIAVHAAAVRRLGGGDPVVRSCGAGLLAEPTTVVEIRRERKVADPQARRRGSGHRR